MQLGLQDKPRELLNVCGYFDLLLEAIAQTARQGYTKPDYARMLMSPAKGDTVFARF